MISPGLIDYINHHDPGSFATISSMSSGKTVDKPITDG